MRDETECLRQYAATGSEDAFTELVKRTLPLVYAAALRQVGGDASLAKDIAQTVFIDLARKARSLAGRELLVGWLYTSTRYAAASAIRSHQRRQHREQRALAMQASTAEPAAPELPETELRQVLDEAMGQLPHEDRNAVLLRFFQDKGLREVGAALGISGDAARMRLNRALEKLQALLTARGVTLSAGALGVVLSAEAASAVPAGLVATIAGTALASTAGAAWGLSPLAKLIPMTKLQVGLIGVVLTAGVAVPWLVQHQAVSRLQQENQGLRQQAAQLAQLTAENERLSNLVASVSRSPGLADDQLRDLMRLRNEVGTLRRQTNELRKMQVASRPAKDSSEAAPETTAAWVPRAEWAFAGYATPEAAFQTTWWALSKGDTNALLTAFHPEVRKQLEAQPEALSQMMQRRDYAEIPGYRILSKLGSADQMLLTVDFLTREDDPNPVSTNHCLKLVALKQCEDGWRFCGTKDLK